jgi:hypothetical protein
MPTEKKLFFSCLIGGLFIYLGMKDKKELVKLLMQFQNDLNAFDEDVVNTWSIEGLSEELDELITQTDEEIEEEGEED